MDGVISKVKEFKEELDFDDESAGLILEDIFCRREIAERCSYDPNNFTPEMYKSVQTKYNDCIIKNAGLEVNKLKNELKEVKDSLNETEQKNVEMSKNIIKNAIKKAKLAKKVTKIVLYILMYAILISLAVAGGYYFISDILIGKLNILAIVVLIFTICGFLDQICKCFKFCSKFINYIANRVYNYVYNKNTSNLIT